MISASVIIPTFGRPEKLRKCLIAIANQNLPLGDQLEVIVAADGGAVGTIPSDVPNKLNIQILDLPRGGMGVARNNAIEKANGEILLFLNDDCYPEPNWARVHLQAQSASPGMYVGRTDWKRWQDETVFDGLVRETSMVFFQAGMQDGHRYGFRHFWTCNASVPRALARSVGGFAEDLRPYGFEDTELGFRIERATGDGVGYLANATCEHDHRMEWFDYLNRESCLGRMAACLAEINIECFEAVYEFETIESLHRASIEWLQLSRSDVARARSKVEPWMQRRLESITNWDEVRELIYTAHLPIKRWAFRNGLVEGYELRRQERWRDRLSLGHSFP